MEVVSQEVGKATLICPDDFDDYKSLFPIEYVKAVFREDRPSSKIGERYLRTVQLPYELSITYARHYYTARLFVKGLSTFVSQPRLYEDAVTEDVYHQMLSKVIPKMEAYSVICPDPSSLNHMEKLVAFVTLARARDIRSLFSFAFLDEKFRCTITDMASMLSYDGYGVSYWDAMNEASGVFLKYLYSTKCSPHVPKVRQYQMDVMSGILELGATDEGWGFVIGVGEKPYCECVSKGSVSYNESVLKKGDVVHDGILIEFGCQRCKNQFADIPNGSYTFSVDGHDYRFTVKGTTIMLYNNITILDKISYVRGFVVLFKHYACGWDCIETLCDLHEAVEASVVHWYNPCVLPTTNIVDILTGNVDSLSVYVKSGIAVVSTGVTPSHYEKIVSVVKDHNVNSMLAYTDKELICPDMSVRVPLTDHGGLRDASELGEAFCLAVSTGYDNTETFSQTDAAEAKSELYVKNAIQTDILSGIQGGKFSNVDYSAEEYFDCLRSMHFDPGSFAAIWMGYCREPHNSTNRSHRIFSRLKSFLVAMYPNGISRADWLELVELTEHRRATVYAYGAGFQRFRDRDGGVICVFDEQFSRLEIIDYFKRVSGNIDTVLNRYDLISKVKMLCSGSFKVPIEIVVGDMQYY